MGCFKTFPIWEEISEKEYSKWETKWKTDLEESCIECLLFGTTHKKEPIYERQGLFAMIDPSNPILGYKYYKKVGEELCYICGSEEYKYLTKEK